MQIKMQIGKLKVEITITYPRMNIDIKSQLEELIYKDNVNVSNIVRKIECVLGESAYILPQGFEQSLYEQVEEEMNTRDKCNYIPLYKWRRDNVVMNIYIKIGKQGE